ncbi:alkylmercury lyase [Promicromonospora umidemergens]|uniref:Alkylmercury lyase n=1 Tax=Promicromonospora umidemergens TaxID=629679 RepID=A0ABP8XPF8_9MICO|nr:organomercurial lyase MerB [Promicromonospora umidemergens]MCP2282073.1 alkylmercury lyase [Promicromonospora umidemergens]
MSDEQIQAGVQKLTGVVNANLGMTDMFCRLWRLLAETGQPVSMAELAGAGGWPVEKVQAELERQPGTDWAEDGRVAGFGLTLRPTPHAFTFEDRTVYGFCATDVVNFPLILGRAGVVESTCPATGQRIHVELSPDGVLKVDPPQAVVSKVHLTRAVANIRDLCDLGHFFSSPQAAEGWLTAHPDDQIVPVIEEFEVGRRAMDELGWIAPATNTRTSASAATAANPSACC